MADTVLAHLDLRAVRTPAIEALRLLRSGGAAHDRTVSWGEWRMLSREFAAALVSAGLRSAAPVAVLAGNNLLWPIADMGALMAGMVSVGLYPTSAAVQVRQALVDCGAQAVVVDSAAQLEKVLQVRAHLPELRFVIVGQPLGDPAVEVEVGAADSLVADSYPRVVGMSAWLAAGGIALGDPQVERELESRSNAVRTDDTAALIYTSGSTGEPKGARLSHAYLVSSAESVRDTLGLREGDRALSFLPFCHAGERVFGLYTRIVCGMSVGLVEDHQRVWDAAAEFGPSLFGGLPRFYEKLHESLEAERRSINGSEGKRWDRALELGHHRGVARRAGALVDPGFERSWNEESAPLRERLAHMLGGRVRLATSGGAPLPPVVAEYLEAIDLPVLGAYGLTEHLCVACHRPDSYGFDSVGTAMPGTELRVAEDGELLVRRNQLTFSGYHARPEDTVDAFTSDGGWLRTGDLAHLDERGVVRLVGRKKELIALSTGKKVAPLPLEQLIARDPLIAQAMVHGEGRKYLVALIAPRRDAIEAWASDEGIRGEWPALLEHPAVVARIGNAVEGANGNVSRTESVKRFALIDHELSVEEGELTPTMKIRRPVVAEKFRDRLEALYR